MKRTIYLTALFVVVAMASCEKDLPLYSDTTGRLNFYYDIEDVSEF